MTPFANTAIEMFPIIPSPSTGGTCGCSSGDKQHDSLWAQLRAEFSAAVATISQELIGPSPASRIGAEWTLDDSCRDAVVSTHQPLPILPEITYHAVDGKHVWVAVQRGALVVFNDSESQIMSRFVAGESPRAVTQQAGTSWKVVSGVIGRLATSGFLKTVQGYTEHKINNPGKFARFHLTKACQLECIHCYADSSPHVDRSNELSTERWIRLAKDFAAQGGQGVLFTGGEALIHKGCIPAMRAAKEESLRVTLFTNGLLVRRYLNPIVELCDNVQVSLDGPDSKTNDVIRGHGTYQKILDAIYALTDRRVNTRIGMTVMLGNWVAWKEQFLQFATQFAGRSIEFRLSFGITQYGRGEHLEEVPVEEVRPVAMRFMEKLNGSVGPKITRTTTGCGYAEQVVIGPDGILYPCHLLDAPICHVDEHPMTELVEILRRIANRFDVDHVEGCDKCDIRYLCGGMCRVIQGGKTGSRLITMCTPGEKARKLRNLANTYAQECQ